MKLIQISGPSQPKNQKKSMEFTIKKKDYKKFNITKRKNRNGEHNIQ